MHKTTIIFVNVPRTAHLRNAREQPLLGERQQSCLIPLGIAASLQVRPRKTTATPDASAVPAPLTSPWILLGLPACRVLEGQRRKNCHAASSKQNPASFFGFIKTGHEERTALPKAATFAAWGRAERQGLALVAKKHDALVNDAPKQLVLSFRKLLLAIKGVGVVALVDLILDG